MDFDDTAEEAAFRLEARAFLDAHATLRTDIADASPPDPQEHVRRCTAWQRTLFDAGWAGLTWPKSFGGRGLGPLLARVYAQEEARYDVSAGIFTVGVAMVGPTLMAHGSDAQKQQHLRPILTGEHLWCQLFSEPGAGSDLAGLATRAERDGDTWVVNGQKVWTSFGHIADWGILLARTSPDNPKHRGITYFLVDMRTAGIEVRPLRQITGVAHFNEVFLSDVRIPIDNVVGQLDDGWRVTATTLANERGAIGGSGFGPSFAEFAALAREQGETTDARLRQQLAHAYIRFEVLRFLGMRVQTALSQGRPPGPESSVMKNLYARHVARNGDLVMTLSGMSGALVDYARPEQSKWATYFLNQWSVRTGGGTEQIQSNIIGERVLGLPREPDLSRDMAWRDIAR